MLADSSEHSADTAALIPSQTPAAAHEAMKRPHAHNDLRPIEKTIVYLEKRLHW